MDQRSSRADSDHANRESVATLEHDNVFDDSHAIGRHDGGSMQRADVDVDGQDGESEHETGPTRSQRGVTRSREGSLDDSTRQRQSIRKPETRSSIRKSRGGRNSYGMTHDGLNPPMPQRTPSARSYNSITRPRRTTSTTESDIFSDDHAVGVENITGPSQAYAMYPQVARSSSVTTASTNMQRISSIPRGPTHPYGMYPQMAFDDPDDQPDVQSAIPLGFPGRGQGFTRQFGPDGEEQDIVGPDGHTEQLPPYSRYPDEGMVKRPLSQAPVEPLMIAPIAAPTPAHRAPIGREWPSTPTGHIAPDRPASATRNSRLVASAPSMPTTPLSPVHSMVHSVGPSESSGMSEKTWKEKSWKEKRRTKFLKGRVPFWVILLIIGFIIVLAVVLGAAIGGFVARQKSDEKALQAMQQAQPQVTMTMTTTASMFDATLLSAVPTGLPALPAGRFFLNLGTPEEQQKGCLTDPTQFEAWTCQLAGPPVTVNITAGGIYPGMPLGMAQLSPFDKVDSTAYGTQPADIQPQKLVLVTDLDAVNRGPAYHFSAVYDKIIVLPDRALPGGVDKRDVVKRNGPGPGSGPFINPQFRRHNRVEPGDFPWMCIWNNTFIEGFIYANQSTGFAMQFQQFASSKAAAAAAKIAATSTATDGSPLSSPTSNLEARQDPSAGSQSSPSPTPTPSPPMSSTSPSSAPSGRTSGQNNGNNNGNFNNFGNGPMGPFPRIVKIEERRLPNPSVKPYCQQLQVFPDGSVHPAKDSKGNPVIVNIGEKDPTVNDFSSVWAPPTSTATAGSAATDSFKARRMMHAPAESHRRLHRRDDPPDSCHCQWVSS